ncbi:MAG: hypothetical protein Q8O40_01420 [Chloroflexota bacterium]|nr:hypothetical protein [Chloroflexota bacterium]
MWAKVGGFSVAAHTLARFNLYMGKKRTKHQVQAAPSPARVLLVYGPAVDAASRLHRAYQLALEAAVRAEEGSCAKPHDQGDDGASEWPA